MTMSPFTRTGITCATGHEGTVTLTPCAQAGTAYTVSGCTTALAKKKPKTLSDFKCLPFTYVSNYPGYPNPPFAYKFGGAATGHNGLVVFAPNTARCVGTYNPATKAYLCVDHPKLIFRKVPHTLPKFVGATTANNGLVVFAPYFSSCVGTFNPSTSVYNCVDIPSNIINTIVHGARFYYFHGATTANNGIAVFAPLNADCVGTFDPVNNIFSCVDISSTISINGKFVGATTANNGLVVFAPATADCVGTFDPVNSAFSCVDLVQDHGRELSSTIVEIQRRHDGH